MKHNVLFILTHAGADTISLEEAMRAARPNVQLFNTHVEYQSYDELQYLRRMPNNRSASSVWADILWFNHSLSRFLLPHVDVMGYISVTQDCEAKMRDRYGAMAESYFTNRLMGIKQFVDRKDAVVVSEPGEPSPRLVRLARAFFPEGSLS